MTDFHAITLMFLIMIFALACLWVVYKINGITAYTIFYCGVILFLFVGYIGTILWSDDIPSLVGGTQIMYPIIPDILIFWGLATIFLFIQSKNKGSVKEGIDTDTQRKLEKIGKAASYVTASFVLYVLLAINIESAPLMNIGTYTASQMAYFRSELYQVPIVQRTYVLQYVISYLVIPVLFLFKGLGMKINRLLLAIFLFFSVLSLSKTFVVIIIVFYFFGRFLNTGKKRKIIQMALCVAVVFYAIVYATYVVDVSRSFVDVTEILIIRTLFTPIALSGVYAEIFTFEQGLRRSEYYTWIFGGQIAPIASIAMNYVHPLSDGNAPTGIIGMAYPNVPKIAHFVYYLVFIIFVWVTSNSINTFSNYYLNIALTGAFGIMSWFIFLTDPLSAMNSYGLLYIFAFVMVFSLLKNPKRRKRYLRTSQ